MEESDVINGLKKELAKAEARGDPESVEHLKSMIGKLQEKRLDLDDMKVEEFECPPGRITVDLVDDPQDERSQGIHIHFFDPTVCGDADTLDLAMMPKKHQWNHVKEQILTWLDQNLE